MYQKLHNSDELISNILVSFVLFCMFGIMFYNIYYDTGGWTLSSYFYVALSGITLLFTIGHFVIYLISLKRPILDYQIDVENEFIKMPFARKIPFNKIKLFATRKNRSELKIYYRTSILNIILFHLKDENGNELTYDMTTQIDKYANKINHRILYNYNLLLILVLIGVNLVYVLVQDQFLFIHQTYKYFIVLGSTIGFALVFIGIHTLILNNIFKKSQQENNGDTTM